MGFGIDEMGACEQTAEEQVGSSRLAEVAEVVWAEEEAGDEADDDEKMYGYVVVDLCKVSQMGSSPGAVAMRVGGFDLVA